MSEENVVPSAKPTWKPKAVGMAAVLVVGAGVALTQREEIAELNMATEPSPEPVVAEQNAVVASSFKDGIYSTTGNYVSPAGPETIDVTLTVEGEIVTAASVKTNATNPVSTKMQAAFIDGYSPLVVGKKLSELSLSKVSGASLTTNGFNEALVEIRTQASV